MQKFYVIPPLKHMDLATYNGCKAVYCLANFCLKENNPDYKEYKQFFIDKKAEGCYVTLDNGAAENSLVTEDILIDLCKELQPDEVISIDILFNKDKTLKALTDFIIRLNQENLTHISIFAVPQGQTVSEYLECYISMLNNMAVHTIGLSKISVPECFKHITDSTAVSVNRRYLIKLLNELKLLRKPIHCLGMRNITEFKAYKNIPMIRSTDSCYTVLTALNGNTLSRHDVCDDINETPHDYFFKTLSKEDLERAKHNIMELKKVIVPQK